MMLTLNGFGQTKDEINQYTRAIDAKRKSNKLQSVDYPNMSFCGGSLHGYFEDSVLVYLTSRFGAEAGYSTKKAYFKDGEVVKMIHHQHYAEWEKHAKNFPNDEGYKNMTYSDTTFYIYTGEHPFMYTYSKQKYISEIVDLKLYDQLINCCHSMKLELEGNRKEAFDLIKYPN